MEIEVFELQICVLTDKYRPWKKHKTDACFDIRVRHDAVLKRNKISILKTGLWIALPNGWHAEIYPRSGLAALYGMTIINSPGIIDCDYRDEIRVIATLIGGTKKLKLIDGERIAQMRFVADNIDLIKWKVTKEVKDLPKPFTDRNGGLGSTGRK